MKESPCNSPSEPMEKGFALTVPETLSGKRADLVLHELLPEFSRARLQKFLEEGLLSCNGEKVTGKKTPLRTGDQLYLSLPEAPVVPPERPEPENIPLEVLYEDPHILVINKAPGMVVHPGAGNWTGTLVNALAGRYPEWEEEFSDAPISSERPGIVHRLDKDTSGCLVVAKDPDVLFKLSSAFQEKLVSKTYYAILKGVLKQPAGELINHIGRHKTDRKKMAVLKSGGKEAITRYRILEEGMEKDTHCKVSLAEVKILTGRTHQIRVHMSFLGAPVAGDSVYGGASKLLPGAVRQMLHACKLEFPHPVTGKMLSFFAPFPEDYRLFAGNCGITLPSLPRKNARKSKTEQKR